MMMVQVRRLRAVQLPSFTRICRAVRWTYDIISCSLDAIPEARPSTSACICGVIDVHAIRGLGVVYQQEAIAGRTYIHAA